MLCHVFYKAQRRTERVAATGSPKRAKTKKTKKMPSKAVIMRLRRRGR
jgi:hypothetical protein